MADPLVSVIMGVYNNHVGLLASLESLRAQTFPSFEVILVDDGSAQPTWDAITGLHFPNLRAHRHPHNQGLAAALNTAAGLARGRFLARHDPEDTSDPTRFEKQVAFLERHPQVAVLGSQVNWITSRGEPVLKLDCLLENEAIQALLPRKNAMAHGSVMIRRAIFERVSGYRSAFVMAQDYDLWLRMAEVSRLANLPETLYTMRFSAKMGSVSRASEQRAYADLARRLAAERRSAQGEQTDLAAEAAQIHKKFRQASPISAALTRSNNYVHWADRLLSWDEQAAQFAWPLWAHAVTTFPFNPRVWRFAARQLRDALKPAPSDAHPDPE